MRLSKVICVITVVCLSCWGCSSSTDSGDTDGGDNKEPTTEYSFSVSIDPSDAGSVTPSSGNYDEGTEVTVEADPNDGWTFEEWSGDQQSEENPLTFTITENTSLTANFLQKESKYAVQMVAGDGQNSIDLGFGQDVDGTGEFDDSLDQEAPPPPPADALHAFFKINDLSLFKDFRSSTKQQVQWKLNYQVSSNRDFQLDWNIPDDAQTPGNLILTDESSSFEVDMLNNSAHAISGTSNGTLIINYSFE